MEKLNTFLILAILAIVVMSIGFIGSKSLSGVTGAADLLSDISISASETLTITALQATATVSGTIPTAGVVVIDTCGADTNFIPVVTPQDTDGDGDCLVLYKNDGSKSAAVTITDITGSDGSEADNEAVLELRDSQDLVANCNGAFIEAGGADPGLSLMAITPGQEILDLKAQPDWLGGGEHIVGTMSQQGYLGASVRLGNSVAEALSSTPAVTFTFV